MSEAVDLDWKAEFEERLERLEARVFPIWKGGRAGVKISCKLILHLVSLETGVPMARLVSNQRSKNVAHARFIAMWLARNLTGQSLVQIGRNMGDRDHTTIISEIIRAEALRLTDPKMDYIMTKLETILKGELT